MAWSTYETNVQSYRQISVSLQSLLLAVGAILMERVSVFSLALIALLALILTWYVWFPVIFCRTAIVDFHKFDLASAFTDEGLPALEGAEHRPLREKDYAHFVNFALRRRIYRHQQEAGLQPMKTLRATRFKIDVLVPALTSSIWVVLLVAAAVHS